MKVGLIDVEKEIERGHVKPICGYKGKYLVSNKGLIISLYRYANIHGIRIRIDNPKILNPQPDKKGYMIVNLYDEDGVPKSCKVHRLVACAFLNNPENKRCVCHKDNDPSNNCVENLYWGTDKENQKQAWEDGLHKNNMPVIQISKQGDVISTFVSQCDAARATHISQQNIAKCIAGKRKSAGGYKWKKLD